MSVIYKCRLGAFLSHALPSEVLGKSNRNHELQDEDGDGEREICRDARTNTLSDCSREAEGRKTYRWKRDLFAVNAPFMMDSQADRISREAVVVDSGGDMKDTSAQRKRKRKSRNKPVLSESEMKAAEVISETLPRLIEQARELRYLNEALPPSGLFCSNSAARAAAQLEGCAGFFQELCCSVYEEDRHGHQDSSRIILLDEGILLFKAGSILGRLICNTEDISRTIQVDKHQFIIPPRSSFLMSSFRNFVASGCTQLQVKDGYSLIVIDPPWNNKSVKRKKSYNMVQEPDLEQIPVEDLAARNCLVCMWVTNNDRLESFVRDVLFPHWSVDLIAQWFWMKVTTHGEPVCNILSPHKKPYEKLLIGCVKKPLLKVSEVGLKDVGDMTPPSDVLVTDVTEAGCDGLLRTPSECEPCFPRTAEDKVQDLPKDFLLVSVPCSLHSKKPSLADIMSQYLPANPKCLELFARNLTQGWVSWGNEPLLHQHMDYLEPVL